jgi:hypothetical protein
MRRAPRPAAAAAAALTAVALLAAAGAALGAPAATTALNSAQAAEWNAYVHDINALTIGGQQLGGTVENALNHAYSTPLGPVIASNAYTGGDARLRRVVSDLAAGKNVKIVALGGRATNGSDASAPGRSDYFARYVSYLARAFPSAAIRPVRASVGLAPSAIVVACLERHMPADADLVLLEMTANDGVTMDSSIVNPAQPKAYEMLVRSVMKGVKQPAVVLVQVRGRRMGCFFGGGQGLAVRLHPEARGGGAAFRLLLRQQADRGVREPHPDPRSPPAARNLPPRPWRPARATARAPST